MSGTFDPSSGRRGNWRNWALSILLLAGVAAILAAGHRHYPIQRWLFVVYASYWLGAGAVVLGCLAAGMTIVRRCFPGVFNLGERWLMAMALGVLTFTTFAFLAGLVGVLGTAFFFAAPAALLAFGARDLFAASRSLWRHRRPLIRAALPRTVPQACAAGLLLLGCLGVYFQALAPEHIGYDARWYHLPVAEQYAVDGAIRPFAEGWYLGAYPQLASLLYTWAFLSPWSALVDKVMLASHLEWMLFLATVPGVGLVARRLLPRHRVAFASSALFLFPGLFVYDSNLGLGSDHVLAFWAPPLALAIAALARRLDARRSMLVGLMLAGAFLTKYQSVYFFPGVLAALVYLGIRRRDPRPLFVAGATTAIAWAPHWLKNWIWYGDPFHPLGHRLFGTRPFHAHAVPMLERHYFPPSFKLTGTALEKIVKTGRAVVAFAFEPTDWWTMHRDVPVFGFLFTLLLATLFFVRGRRRVIWLALAAEAGVAVYYVTGHEDRFLQALVPWMAACVAAILVLLWSTEHRPVRGAVTLLVLAQLVWGADAFFFQTHAMSPTRSNVKDAVDLIAAGHERRYSERMGLRWDLHAEGEALPRGAHVLAHRFRGTLGLGRVRLFDEEGFQGAFDYSPDVKAAAIGEEWRKRGVTHVMWEESGNHDADPERLAAEIVFAEAAGRNVGGWRSVDHKRIAPVIIPPARPSAATTDKVLVLDCGDGMKPGLYDRASVAVNGAPAEAIDPARLPAQLDGPDAVPLSAAVYVLRPGCPGVSDVKARIEPTARHVLSVKGFEVWVPRP